MIKNIQRTLPKNSASTRKAFSSASPGRAVNSDSFAQRHSNQYPEQKPIESTREHLSKPRKSISSVLVRSGHEDFQVYLQNSIKEMTEKKEKLQSCIKFFNLMQSHNAQVRCLTHSNILTIYCLTQRRALCANCVYGVTKHRTHKLIPLKDSNNYILEDNNMLWKIIQSDLSGMDESIKNIQETTLNLQKQLKRRVRDIEDQFIEKAEQLKTKYALRKKRVQGVFEGLIVNSRNLEKIVEQFKFKVWQTLSKVGIGKRNEGNNSDIQVSKQVLCVNMSEITKITIIKMTQKDIQKLQSRLLKS